MSEVELTAEWHEARAADLLRPTRDWADATEQRQASPADVDRAKAHAAVAQSIRTGQLAAATRAAATAQGNALLRIAERLRGLR